MICFGQLDKDVDARIDVKISGIPALIDKKISDFSKRLDSVVTKTVTTSGTIFIDTLDAPKNGVGFFQLSLTGISGNNIPSCVKVILVRNNNGVYTIPRNVTTVSYAGLTGGNFDAVIVNGKVVVKITGTSVTSQWFYKKQSL